MTDEQPKASISTNNGATNNCTPNEMRSNTLNSNDPFSKDRPEILELPASAANFDKVIIQGKGLVSTEALERLAELNINVIMLDNRGKLYSY